MRNRITRWSPLREAEGGGGAGGGTGGADPAAGGTGEGGGDGGAQPKWFEAARFSALRPWIDAKGYSVDDPLDALDRIAKGYNSAEKFLGKPADRLIERPADGASLAEWLRGAGLGGLPESPEKYEITRPELPKGVEWDESLETEARKIAHEHGVAPAALNALIAAYGQRLGSMETDAAAQLQAANEEMMTALERDWGQAAPAKIAIARSAAQAIGEKVGLAGEALANVVAAIALKTGDAGVTRIFAAIGEMMGEDTLKGVNAGGGMATTPAEAKAQLAAMDAPDGAYGKAYGRGDMAEMKRLRPQREALMRIAAAAGG